MPQPAPARTRRTVALAGIAAALLLLPAGPSAAAAPGAAASPGAAAATFGAGVSDTFNREVQHGFGRTDTRQLWRVVGDARHLAVGGGRGTITLPGPGVGVTASLDGALSEDIDLRATLALDRLQSGNGTYVSVLGRSVAGLGDYRLEVRFLPDRSVRASLVAVLGGRKTALATSTVSGVRYAPGSGLRVRLDVAGASRTTLRAKVWPAAGAEPAGWLLRADDGTSALQTGGTVGLGAYLSSGAAGGGTKVSFDDVRTVTSRATSPSPAGTGKPGGDNTGVPSGTVLRRHDGDLVITKAGARYDALDVHGFVIVRADDVRITRSRIRGRTATTNIGLITNYLGKRLVVEDSDLVPDRPSVWIDGIKGSRYTARRVEVRGTNDAVKVHGDDVRVEGSWLHDTVHRSQDPNLGGAPSHNDGVQVLGGRNIRILGNTITGHDNAGLQVTQDYSATTDLVFSGNWVDGGGCSVNLAAKPRSGMGGIAVDDNRFGRNTRIRDCAILGSTTTTFSAEGNVWDDDGTPVRVRRNG